MKKIKKLRAGSSCQSIINHDKVGNVRLKIAIPCEGNCWVVNNSEENETLIKEGGIQNWNPPSC